MTWAVLGAYITVFFDSKWFLMVVWCLKNVFRQVVGSKAAPVAMGRPKVADSLALRALSSPREGFHVQPLFKNKKRVLSSSTGVFMSITSFSI